MIHLLLIVVAVALADSLNPATVLPALYLATTPRPVRAVLGFAAGAILTGLVGGLVLLWAGDRLAQVVPRPPADLLHWAELAIGVGAIGASVVLWRRREAVGAGFSRAERGADRFAPVVGSTIIAVEFPTAFPYFAVIAAIAASDVGPLGQVSLLLLFNVLFLAPVLAIAAARALAGDGATEVLARLRGLVLRNAGAVAALLVLAVGIALVMLGAVGLAGS